MNGLSWAYAFRNLKARRLTSLLTIAGMALVTFVFAAVLMMAEGLQHTLGITGARSNVVLLRRGAETEVQSAVSSEEINHVAVLPGLATDATGQPLLSREVLVLVNLPRKRSGELANVVVRGTSNNGLALRRTVGICEGRLFRPGTSEVVVGSAVARGHAGMQIGSQLHFGQRDWRVVGVFNGGNSGFDSEIWGDGQQMLQAFHRQSYSSVVAHLQDAASFERLRHALSEDPRLQLSLQRESEFYAAQSRQLANFIGILGKTITVVFSVGAVLGAMITMYASVANRTREIGTLRALGFTRKAIVASFLQEAVVLGTCAGLMGLFAAAWLQLLEISTTNIQTFSEVVFRMQLTPAIAFDVLFFAIAMGILGGVLPAMRAAKLEIVEALRT